MRPVVLGLDTSGSCCSAALVVGPDVAVRRLEVGNAHSEHLLDMVRAVLDEAASDLDLCDVVAFSAGPGSFTGVRVACAVAQGLAFGASLPVAVVGTLDAIAWSVVGSIQPAPISILAVQDARMGEVYWALFEYLSGRLRPVAGPALARPDALAARLASAGQRSAVDIGVGNAWSLHPASLDGLADRVVHRDAADAVDVARLGAASFLDGDLVTAERAAPIYVRDDVARTTAERNLAAAGRRSTPVAAVARSRSSASEAASGSDAVDEASGR